MILDTISIFTVILSLWFLFHKKIRTSPTWHATVTPLASIIGSGFLVSAPLLIFVTGKWAVLVMLVIIVLAYGLGESLRFNIRYVEPLLDKSKDYPWVIRVEDLSRPILGLAYIISVAFYLKLLSAFVVRGTGIGNGLFENSLTTILLLYIGITGKLRGLNMLEWLEVYSVNTKLAIIASLIVTHFIYNVEMVVDGLWELRAYAHDDLVKGIRQVLGMLIIIQGFETSRYLGETYSADKRIQTMRYAQWISGFIYVVFLALAMIVFNDIKTIHETTIIDLVYIVAPVLYVLLIIAAAMSQFSAAIADTLGAGGLLTEGLRGKLSLNSSYLLITLVGIGLTWLTNIYEIITIASKAFAVYYAIQLLLSLLTLRALSMLKSELFKAVTFSFLFIVLLMVIIFGLPVE